MTLRRSNRRFAAALLTLFVFAGGCAGNRVLNQADLEMQRGNLDTAIAHYQQVLIEEPGNTEARIKLSLAKVEASQQHESAGVAQLEAGNYEQAVQELRLAVRLDSANEMAMRRLGEAQAALEQQRRAEELEMTPQELAQQEAAERAPVIPQLEPEVDGPITLDFRDIAVGEIYRTLAQLAGLNVLFEPTLDAAANVSFQVSNTSFEDALRVLTASNGHFTKVLTPNTFMVIPDDVTKRREYADQVMRTFFLSNADSATVETQIRAILASQQISSNPELNTITVRDTPEAVGVIERLITSADKAVGEILLEVEILEVSREVVANYGLALEPFSGNVSIPQGGEEGAPAGISLEDLGNLTSADVFVTVPSLFYQFLRTTNDFKLVAQPKLRAREGEATTLLIGDEVPVVTTTFNPQSTIGGNVVPVSSTEYRDTGISLSVLPRVHFNGEITLELLIQVSAVSGTSTIASVGELPVFTTREVTGSIRLKDGETNVIAGLLQDNDIRNRRGIIGVDQVPGVGDALSGTTDTSDQTDIVISITPHLLRAAEITPEDLEQVYVGTSMAVTGGAFAVAAGGGGVGGVAAGQQPGVAGAGDQEEIPPASMSMLPAEHVVTVDEEFAVDIALDTVGEAFSAGLQLSFDPAVVSYVDYFEGNFLGRDGAEVTAQVTEAGPGIIRVGMTRMGTQAGVSGGGSLVTLVFRAAAEGQTAIDISSAALRGPQGSPLAVQMNGAQVTVRQQE